jgi:hypothetical protein
MDNVGLNLQDEIFEMIFIEYDMILTVNGIGKFNIIR